MELDNLKTAWQKQEIKPRVSREEILQLVQRKSRNVVQYILWISLAELLLVLGLMLYYLFNGEGATVPTFLQRVGLHETPRIRQDFAHLYFALKIFTLLVTSWFVYRFFRAYREIRVEANLAKFIRQLLGFQATVRRFILVNFLMMVLFIAVIGAIVLHNMRLQNLSMDTKIILALTTGSLLSVAIAGLLVWVYYRVVYGFLLADLRRNLKQLQEMERE